MNKNNRIIAMACVVALLFPNLILAKSTSSFTKSPDLIQIERIAGADRYETAVKVSLATFKSADTDGFLIRRESVENNIPCLTSLDTASAVLKVLESMRFSIRAY